MPIATFMTKTGLLAKIRTVAAETITYILPYFFALQARAAWLIGRIGRSSRPLQGQSQQIDLNQVHRVLLLGLGEIGDVVMLSPLIRELRNLLPGRHITLVVTPRIRQLVELCPYIDELLLYDPYVPLLLRPFVLPWRAYSMACKSLRARAFDLAIQPRWDEDRVYLSFLTYFSGARWRVGYSEKVLPRKQRLNRGFDRLFTHVLADNESRHEVTHSLEIVRFLGGRVEDTRQEVWLDAADQEFARDLLSRNSIDPHDLLVAIHPGANHRKRRWPIERYAEIGAMLIAEYDARIVVIGGSDIADEARELTAALGERAVSVAGQCSLRQTAALLQRYTFYLGNDTGPAHLAAAAGIPVIEISCHPLDGSPEHVNSPERFHPWGVPYTVLQPPTALPPCAQACNARDPHCILQVDTQYVKQAIRRQLSLLQEPASHS